MGSTAPRPLHVLIIGAGVGGLFLAQFLRKQGVDFSIYERDASPDARFPGWAIGLSMLDNFNSYMLDDVPPLRDANHLLPLDLPSQFIMYPPGGVRIGIEDTPETPCVRVNRKRLRHILLTKLPVHWGKKLVRIEEAGTRVTAHFEDGTWATGDLLVGADGSWSKTREYLLGKSNTETLEPMPISVISGETTVAYDGTADSFLERQLRLGYSGYVGIRPPGTTFFCGVDRVSPAADAVSFYWFLYMRDDHAADADQWLRTATKEERYDRALAHVEAHGLEARHTEILRHATPDDVHGTFALYYDALLASLPTKDRRILLLGDAAHPMTPFRGEGGIMAIKDALQLSTMLAEATKTGMDETTLQGQLDALQDDICKSGAAAVQMTRNAILGAGGPANPTNQKPQGWGFEARPMPESTRPLGLRKAAL